MNNNMILFSIEKISKITSNSNFNNQVLNEWSILYTYFVEIKIKDKLHQAQITTTLDLNTNLKYTSKDFNIVSGVYKIKHLEPIIQDVEVQLILELYKEVPNFPKRISHNIQEMIADSDIHYLEIADYEFENHLPTEYIKLLMSLKEKYYKKLGFDFLLNLFHYYTFGCKMRQIDEDTTWVYAVIKPNLYNIKNILKDPYFTSITNLSSYDDINQSISEDYPLKSIGLLHEVFLQSIGQFRSKGSKSKKFFYNQQYSYLKVNEIFKALNTVITIDKKQLSILLNNAVKIGLLTHIDDKYYLSDIYNKELYIQKKVEAMNNKSINYKLDDNIIDVASSPKSHGKDQKRAIKNIVSSKTGIKIMTGGPGTGKTTTLSTIVKLYKAIYKVKDEELLFLAPTAKAKGVLSNSLGMPAYTLKEALLTGIIYNAKLVVVDEVGVVSLADFYELMAQINTNQKLLLIGDEAQLQSIDYGLILKDIKHNSGLHINKLKEVFRQESGSPIIDLAYAINGQKISKSHIEGDNDTLFVEKIPNLNTFIQNLDIELDFFNKLNYIQLIAPNSRNFVENAYKNDRFRSTFPLSANYVNRKIQEYKVQKYDSKHIKVGYDMYVEGDKVMHMKNLKNVTSIPSYKGENFHVRTGIFNGDTGIIYEITEDYIFVLLEDNSLFRYNLKNNTKGIPLSYLDIAYVITIMKSQGSEWNTVILLLDDNSYTKLALTRNLLYVAVTRASSNLIIGYNFIDKSKSLLKYLKEGASKSSADKRRSDLFLK